MSDEAFAPYVTDVRSMCPPGTEVLDAHTHLGVDEDGQSQTLDALLALLDQAAPGARACAFALHDPDRNPAYRRPNDRILDWAVQSDGRIVPYCRLDPTDDPIGEAERCLARGARGIKLHPRAQGFTFTHPVIDDIFAVARDAAVPIIVHAGMGMPPMEALAAVALRYPEVALVLAHAAIADQGMFATRLADHPAVLYDTAWLSPFDVVELFARVPAERIVFASDAPYGNPLISLFQALRVGNLAGLDPHERNLLVGGTMTTALNGAPLPDAQPPRLSSIRPVSGRLMRTVMPLSMAFGALFGSGSAGHPDLARMRASLALARCACRDPSAGADEPALQRIDTAIRGAEQLIAAGGQDSVGAIALVHAAVVIAATEP